MSEGDDLTHNGFEARKLRKIQQRERFRWLAEGMRSRVDDYTVEQIEKLLYGDTKVQGQREKALVLLALKGTRRASNTLQAFDPGDDDELDAFYTVVLGEHLKTSTSLLNQTLSSLDETSS